MSHFAVMVVGDKVEEKLDPFWELDLSQEEASNDYRAEFNDQTQEFVDEYEGKGVEMVETPEGLKFPWDERFRVSGTHGTGSNTHEVPAHLKKVQVPHKKRFKSVDEFAKEWHCSTRLPNGKFGYFSNPKAKWDWHSIGGRWSGHFIHKEKPKFPDDISKAVSRFEDKDSKDKAHKRSCDVVRKCDIDLKEMQSQARTDAERWWSEAHSKSDVEKGMVYGIESGDSRMKYVEKHVARCLSVFAFVLDDGSWIEKGKMGWWGVTHGEKEDWDEQFKKIFDSLPDDALLTIVDCHI